MLPQALRFLYRSYGEPVVHLGPVASGRRIALDDQLRQEFAARHGVKCYDAELDAVVDSICGNRKDQYTLIRGIADYQTGTNVDGSHGSGAAGQAGGAGREWQQYAALMAAAVFRSVVEEMPPPVL